MGQSLKLFWSPYASSLAIHILLEELGLKYDQERVGITGHKGGLLEYNPRGYTPTLVVDSSMVLTEVLAIMLYLSNQHPHKRFTPPHGTMEYYQCVSWSSYVATELHKAGSPLIRLRKELDEAQKMIIRDLLNKEYKMLDEYFSKHTFLMDNKYSISDMHLFTILGWKRMLKVDLTPYASLTRYIDSIDSRLAVQKALKLQRSR